MQQGQALAVRRRRVGSAGRLCSPRGLAAALGRAPRGREGGGARAPIASLRTEWGKRALMAATPRGRASACEKTAHRTLARARARIRRPLCHVNAPSRRWQPVIYPLRRSARVTKTRVRARATHSGRFPTRVREAPPCRAGPGTAAHTLAPPRVISPHLVSLHSRAGSGAAERRRATEIASVVALCRAQCACSEGRAPR